jgi:hypothetical protein
MKRIAIVSTASALLCILIVWLLSPASVVHRPSSIVSDTPASIVNRPSSIVTPTVTPTEARIFSVKGVVREMSGGKFFHADSDGNSWHVNLWVFESDWSEIANQIGQYPYSGSFRVTDSKATALVNHDEVTLSCVERYQVFRGTKPKMGTYLLDNCTITEVRNVLDLVQTVP